MERRSAIELRDDENAGFVGLREGYREAVVENGLGSYASRGANFRARVSIPSDRPATGDGSEAHNDFRDDTQKAWTEALGRVLVAVGFGTQFCPDFQLGAREGRVVDAPVALTTVRGACSTPSVTTATVQRSTPTGTMTAEQVGDQHEAARLLHLSEEELGKEAQAYCSKSVDKLGCRRLAVHAPARRAKRPSARVLSSEGTPTP